MEGIYICTFLYMENLRNSLPYQKTITYQKYTRAKIQPAAARECAEI